MSNSYEQILADFIDRYGAPAGELGPEMFVEEVFGVVPEYDDHGIHIPGTGIDDWQRDVLKDFGGGERRISIRSCHGPGKTAVVAWCVVYQLIFRFPQKTVATAPTRGQLFDALFAEVMTWFTKLPTPIQDAYNCKSDRIEMIAAPDESFFSARTARRESPEALQGVHAPHVLLIADEASGVEEMIYEAAIGSMSGHNATTILASNPTKTSGFFFDTQNKLKRMGPDDDRDGTWKCYHISGHDSARVTEDFMKDVAARYGEDSNAYRVRALGEFPKTDEDTMIPFYLVDAASQRDIVVPKDADKIWGLDVARFGGDVSALCQRTAHSVDWVEEYKALDLMQLVGRVHNKYNDLLPSQQPKEILVDVIGMGAGVLDRLRELGLPARGINVSESASMKDTYINLRAELWAKAKEWLDEKACTFAPGTVTLQRELVVPRYMFTSGDRIKLEAKEDMKKRGFKSPNHADAFVMTFGSNALRAQQGRKAGQKWNEPLRRNLPGIV